MNQSGIGAAWKADGSGLPGWISSIPLSAIMKKENAAKIIWFSLRTGGSNEEAKKWLVLAKWKLEIAIRMRNISIRNELNQQKKTRILDAAINYYIDKELGR